MIAVLGFVYSIKKNVIEDKQPIQELNITITRLNTNFEHMLERDKERDKRLNKQGEEIDENSDNIIEMKHEIANHETRIKSLENWKERNR